MIEIRTYNENKDGYDLELHMEGDGAMLASQLAGIFDRIYENTPELFEAALVSSQYTEDHT